MLNDILRRTHLRSQCMPPTVMQEAILQLICSRS